MAKREQVVLLTGATRGIGRLAALHLAERGHRVVATGRDREMLASLEREAAERKLPMTVAALDVNDGAACEGVVAQAIAQHGRIDALVNNAAYSYSGPLETLALDEVRRQFETNLFSALRLSQLALPHMRKQRFGTIVNVGSVSGLIGNPNGGAYAAAKAGLRAMSQVMRIEVAPFGVRVALIEPGLFRTEFGANQVWAPAVNDGASPYYHHARRNIEARASRPYAGGDPMQVAARIRKVIEARRPKARYCVGLDAAAGAWAVRWLPDGVLEAGVKRATGW